MKLIVGLGNPGREYINTRHNIGYMVLDNYLASTKEPINWQKKFNSSFTTINVNNNKVIFIKPETYMNLSGTAIREFVNFYKLDINNILIIQDDLDLPLGVYRLKYNSSSGGHNGIKSIIDNLGTKEFLRLKVGISHNKNIDTKDYVLGKISPLELETLANNYLIFNNIINDFINNKDINSLMNKYN